MLRNHVKTNPKEVSTYVGPMQLFVQTPLQTIKLLIRVMASHGLYNMMQTFSFLASVHSTAYLRATYSTDL